MNKIASEIFKIAKAILSYGFVKRWIPEGKIIKKFEKEKLYEGYVIESSKGEPFLPYMYILYVGKSDKAIIYNGAKTLQNAIDKIENIINTVEERYNLKIKNREEKLKKKREVLEKSPVNVGDIFYSSWGYDQNNIDYYQVVAINKNTVVVRENSRKRVDNNGHIAPIKDHFIGTETYTCRLNVSGYDNKPYFKVDGHMVHLWNGKPNYETPAECGH